MGLTWGNGSAGMEPFLVVIRFVLIEESFSKVGGLREGTTHFALQ
jgi:hypothetical protein